jgi:large conductance mechanosensitive channel
MEMITLWKEFKEFAFKGNMIELAVAVVIGTAFNAIITSLVDHIITPLVGILAGGIDFTGLSITLGDAEILYGSFIQSFVDFLIIAFSIFIVIRFINRWKKEEEEVVEEKIDDQLEVLTEIRDLLKEKRIR